MNFDTHSKANTLMRIRVLYLAILVFFGIILLRLFYLQVIRQDFYTAEALKGQLKGYEIAPSRGVIEAHDGERIVPIVLNEEKFTLYVDPKLIDNPGESANRIARVIGGSESEYVQAMETDSRYVVIKKKMSKETAAQINKLEMPGVLTRAESYRTYPQGDFASQVLGFVNDDGEGKYGIEQYLNDKLKGTPGQLKAITDARGVPLVANDDNIITQPKSGDRVVLSLDISMQQQLEKVLASGLSRASSKSGGALIMDPYTGEIKAMANFPSYDPGKFSSVKDISTFNNQLVSSPLEVGSVMKPLTMAAALNTNSINAKQSYFDPGYFIIDEKKVENVEEVAGSGQREVVDILRMSLNTGATWLLMQMGGGNINEKARTTWNDYMTNHYQLGKKTNIEQGYEEPGSIPDPNKGFGLNIQYANTAFGQGMSATPMQMGAAISSVINGGNYYQPTLIDKYINQDGTEQEVNPKLIKGNVVSKQTSKTIREFMQEVVKANHAVYGMENLNPKYSIGGKTGTAQITRPEGGYYEDRFNGMFMGFVGGNKPQYVIVVRVNDPGIYGYAGSRAAGPIFSDTADMLINNFAVTPKD